MKIIDHVKVMRNMDKSQYVLNSIGFILEILKGESYKDALGLDNDYNSFEKLLIIAYKIAVKKAITIKEIEMCAVSVEENYNGPLDPDELAEQIRIKAYGLEWYLKRQFNSPAYQEFMDCTNDMEINNPFE